MSLSFDSHLNLVSTLVTNSPGSGGTSIVVTASTSANFPAVPFNCVVYSPTTFPNASNSEIVRVTAVNTGTDTLTVTRAQESTAAIAIAAGYVISLTVTAKCLTDIETAVNGLNSVVSNTGSAGSVNLPLAFGTSNVRYVANVGLQFWNPTTTKWHTLLCTGATPTIGWDAGSS